MRQQKAAQAAFFFDLRFQHLLLFMLPIGWVVPNHYYPWTAAWADAASLLIFFPFFLCLLANSPRSIGFPSWPLCLIFLVTTITACAQWIFGKMVFGGDLILVLGYLSVFALSVQAGRIVSIVANLKWFFCGLLFFALISVAAAVIQTLQLESFGLYVVSLPPDGRPFGNFAQPNNFSSACFLGALASGWLYADKKIGFPLGIALVAVLALGLVLSGSRTGIIQFLIVSIVFFIERARFAFHRAAMLFGSLVCFYVSFRIVIPELLELLLLPTGRSIGEQLNPGLRMEMWLMALRAMAVHPVVGYGWQQGSAVQQDIALLFRPHGEHFEHAHNLVLDLLLWNGVIVGGLVVALFLYWLWRTLIPCGATVGNDKVYAKGLIAAFCVHSMLEYPLEYAYFLIPFGICVGFVDFHPSGQAKLLPSPKLIFTFIAVIFGALFVGVGFEYLKAEERFREFRLQAYGIGPNEPSEALAGYHLLDQLDHYISFASTEAKTGLSLDELENMKNVARRFGYPPVLFRYALALGLNGDPNGAVRVLETLCHIHTAERCVEAIKGWAILRKTHANLPRWDLPQMAPTP